MPTHRNAPTVPGGQFGRLHRWVVREGREVCAECAAVATAENRFTFCRGKKEAEPEDRDRT
jgi:hypothetical protein